MHSMYKENHYFDNFYQTFNYQRKSTVKYANISNKLQLKVFNEANSSQSSLFLVMIFIYIF